MIKQYDTFCVSIPDEETGKKAIVFHILGYDKSKIDNIYIAVSKMLNTMKSREDFIYPILGRILPLLSEAKVGGMNADCFLLKLLIISKICAIINT